MRFKINHINSENCSALVQIKKDVVEFFKKLSGIDTLKYKTCEMFAQGGGWYLLIGDESFTGWDVIEAVDKIKACEDQINQKKKDEILQLMIKAYGGAAKMAELIKTQEKLMVKGQDNVVEISGGAAKRSDFPRKNAKPASPAALKVLQRRLNNRFHRGANTAAMR